MVTPSLFRHPDLSHHVSRDHRSDGNHHHEPRPARPLRQASRNRPLDLATLDVRISHRRNRLFHALPVVPAQLEVVEAISLCSSVPSVVNSFVDLKTKNRRLRNDRRRSLERNPPVRSDSIR